ncbi:hypothetical protein EBR78_08785 [bacterium]|nr:hypothetical protein [bacterium]
MWRVSLSLITHRFFLLVVALAAIHFQGLQNNPSVPSPGVSGIPGLWSQFLQRVSNSREAQEISSPQSTSKDPFIFFGSWIYRFSQIRPEIIVLVLSNLFLFLFLLELNGFVNSLALPEVAVDTCLMSILWLTSYELSLGSSLSLSCFLTLLALKAANDHRWLISGIALALLSLTQLIGLFLLPLLLVIWLGQQKYSSRDELYKRLIYLLVPISSVIFFRWDFYRNTPQMIHASAFFNLLNVFHLKTGLSWALSTSFLGQTLALLVLLSGSIISFFVLSTLLHRLMPIVLLLSLLITTPYTELATSTLLVAPAFTGLAEACAPSLLKGIQLIFLIFGAIEVFNIFS